MSDTTKIDKVRVNGVLYDLAGSGEGGGGYLFPQTLFTIQALDYSEGSYANLVSASAVKQWLINCGVDLTQTALEYDSGEYLVRLTIGPSTSPDVYESLFSIEASADSSNLNFYFVQLDLLGEGLGSFEITLQEGDVLTLSDIIDEAFETIGDNYIDLPNFNNMFQNGVLTYINMGYIFRYSINDYTYYSTAEIEDFIENVIQEASGGSSS